MSLISSSSLIRRWDNHSSPYRISQMSFTASRRLLKSEPLRCWEPNELSVVCAELVGLRAQEREELVGLNDRFASYIEKVRHLEQQNRMLMVQLEALQGMQTRPSRLQQLYKQESQDLRQQLHHETQDKEHMEVLRDKLQMEQEQLEKRWQEEARQRERAEDELQRTRDEADRTGLLSCDAEVRVISLARELAFLKQVFAEEREGLKAQLQVSSISMEPDVSRPDLSAALKEIRAQYESLARRNMQTAETWYQGKVANVAQVADKQQEAVRLVREETAKHRQLLLACSTEVETLRSVINSLNAQLRELEETQSEEVAKYQVLDKSLTEDILQWLTHYNVTIVLLHDKYCILVIHTEVV